MSDILEQKPDHHFRTEIPNIIFELGLCPFSLSLYLFIKKVAGDSGKCWQSVKHLAEACGMCEKKIRESKEVLSSRFEKLGLLPLIKITKRKKEDKADDTDLIEIVPIWRLNGDYFRKPGEGSCREPGGVPDRKGEGSPRAYKEEHSEEEPLKNSPPESKAQPKIINPESHSCALLLRSKILENKPDFKFQSTIDSWTYVIDLMHRRDGRSYESIKKAIEFAQNDDFWMSRVLSPEKLRKQMDTLEMQMASKSKQSEPKQSKQDKLKEKFQHGKKYMGAECFINDNGIAFQRGMTYLEAKFKDGGFDNQLDNILRKLDIKI